MKKLVLVTLAAMFVVFTSNMARAETFQVQDCIKVDADKNGLVTVTGNLADLCRLKLLVQYIPEQDQDKYRGDLVYREPVNRTQNSVTFQLDMGEIVHNGQRQFNFKDGPIWLYIPHPKVVVVQTNLVIDDNKGSGSEDGKGGCGIVFKPAAQ